MNSATLPNGTWPLSPKQADADHYKVLTQIKTAPLARTCLDVPDLDKLFVAVPQQLGHDAEVRVYLAHP